MEVVTQMDRMDLPSLNASDLGSIHYSAKSKEIERAHTAPSALEDEKVKTMRTLNGAVLKEKTLTLTDEGIKLIEKNGKSSVHFEGYEVEEVYEEEEVEWEGEDEGGEEEDGSGDRDADEESEVDELLETRSEDLDDEQYEIREKKLRKNYELNVDPLITGLNIGNYFLGYDKVPEKNKYLVDKKVLLKRKVELAPYGNSWAEDMFAVGHNTVKSEILDMYNIVGALERRGRKVRPKSVHLFYDWWNLFLSVFTVTLDMEEDVIFPWIEKEVDLTGTGMTLRERTETKKHIADLLNIIRVQEAKVGYIPAGEATPKMLTFLNEFVPVVLRYMNKCDQVVAPIVKEKFTEEQYRHELLPFIAKYYREYVDWPEVAPLTTVWMDKKQRGIWKHDFLTAGEKLRFGLWKRELNRTHTEIRDMIVERRQVRRSFLSRTLTK